MNEFRLRPGYGSKNLLIEFTSGPEKTSFVTEITQALSDIDMAITATTDLWMNDEILYAAYTKEGYFTLSIDIWGFAFIIADENQKLIHTIDQILQSNPTFHKEIVDFKRYESLPKKADNNS